MPYYNDLSFYSGYNSTYSPYSTSYLPITNYSSYTRALNGTYNAPPPRSLYTSSIGQRNYKPMLKPISETPFIRSNAMTSLTRINSGKYNNIIKPSIYVAPRPIQINTADIDVSASKFNKNRYVRARSTSPDQVRTVAECAAGSSTDTTFMPRIDQNDPAKFRSTIKRDRHIVRLSTMRKRSKSRSKSNSIEKKSCSSRHSTSSKKSSSDDGHSETIDSIPSTNESSLGGKKTSWRDKFGDSLNINKPKTVRKTPGEIILEKHIIRDRKDEERIALSPMENIVRLPETVSTPEEIAYLEPIIRKSIRRQSLIKCPSFKDICEDISSDIKVDDDLNAGELRRRASLILEQEEQILAQLTSVSRRPSADLVNVDVPIPEVEEREEQNLDKADEPQEENTIIIKKKTLKKGGKIRHSVTVRVDVENPVKPAIALSSESSKSRSNVTTKWRAIVEELEINHSVNETVPLPKKRTDKIGNKELTRSESSEDFWKKIGRRDSIFYKTKFDLKKNEMEIVEILEDVHAKDEKSDEKLKFLSETVECKAQTETSEPLADTVSPVMNKERRNSAIKSKSASDVVAIKDKLKVKTTKPTKKVVDKTDESKIKVRKMANVMSTSSTSKDDAKTIKSSRDKAKLKSNDTENVSTTTKLLTEMKSIENNTNSNVNRGISNEAKSNKLAGSDTSASKSTDDVQKQTKSTAKAENDELKIISGTVAAKADVTGDAFEAKQLKSTSEKDSEETNIANKIKKTSNENEKIAQKKSKATTKKLTTMKNASAKTKSLALPETKNKTQEELVTKTSAGPPQPKEENAKAPRDLSKTVSAQIENQTENIGIDAEPKCSKNEKVAKSSTTKVQTEQHDDSRKDFELIGVDTNNNKVKSSMISAIANVNECDTSKLGVKLNKFPTLSNLNSDLTSLEQATNEAKERELKNSSSNLSKSTSISFDSHNENDDGIISGEENFDLILSSSSDDQSDNSEEYTDIESEDEMGLRRRHRKKKDKFDPKKLVKLDHKRKCYVIDEAPKYPLIATPRPLQKKYHLHSDSDTASTSSECGSSDEFFDECLSPNDIVVKDVIRMSTSSNDSGFEGGGTAPASPKKMLGKIKPI